MYHIEGNFGKEDFKLKPSLYNYFSCHKQLVGKTLVNSKQIGKFALYSLSFSLYLCYSGIIHDAGHCYKALWPLSDSPCCCFTWWKMTLICSNVNNCSHMTSFMWENQKTKANSVWWLPEILVQRKHQLRSVNWKSWWLSMLSHVKTTIP